MSCFGLDIGSESIKLVELKGGGKKLAVSALGYSPLTRSLESESREDLMRVATEIKKLVSVSRATTKNVV
ncbi:pilus assembly protein PilM, partial [Patescibacteria group bacterium]|nr:pilus assembly protein PilM [Patescibacteria group bacterium]